MVRSANISTELANEILKIFLQFLSNSSKEIIALNLTLFLCVLQENPKIAIDFAHQNTIHIKTSHLCTKLCSKTTYTVNTNFVKNISNLDYFTIMLFVFQKILLWEYENFGYKQTVSKYSLVSGLIDNILNLPTISLNNIQELNIDLCSLNVNYEEFIKYKVAEKLTQLFNKLESKYKIREIINAFTYSEENSVYLEEKTNGLKNLISILSKCWINYSCIFSGIPLVIANLSRSIAI